MKTTQEKLAMLQTNMKQNKPITIMIVGLGSVGNYLLDYLVSAADSRMHIVVAGRNAEQMRQDVNIVSTAATIRKQMRCTIDIDCSCDLNNIDSIESVITRWNPDFIVNTSRVYPGLKYGSISWNYLRAYGIWTPLAMKFARNIMIAYKRVECNAISINTSYSDAVIPWLKSAGYTYFDFGSGNLNHLVPRIKFHIGAMFDIANYNDINISLAVSHFHDVVISKEGHSEGQDILLNAEYFGKTLLIDKMKVFAACKIAMPIDQKRNMMNASSNFNIIMSIISAIDNSSKEKFHTPGVNGEIGGYPYIIDATDNIRASDIDTSIWPIEVMRAANRASIYKDGIMDIRDGCLYYTPELTAKVKEVFNVNLPATVKWDEIDEVAQFIISNIIKPNA